MWLCPLMAVKNGFAPFVQGGQMSMWANLKCALSICDNISVRFNKTSIPNTFGGMLKRRRIVHGSCPGTKYQIAKGLTWRKLWLLPEGSPS